MSNQQTDSQQNIPGVTHPQQVSQSAKAPVMNRLHQKKYQWQHPQQSISRAEAVFHGAQEYHVGLSCNDFVTTHLVMGNHLDRPNLLS
jgi:hypothetical protein